ncbi:stage V sporulation protein AC [Shimazuella alba]|uniref:Stage V sporulation protein AC n=1 Tax=Shimazuella alba TaxID=2690964 RepID=A0A6I4VWH0_9BACL|nr:stage V sporulation protein AC [Shimazuella alba]MXQ54435.1 stage V sporulation protein AC [Shimazuella alba]
MDKQQTAQEKAYDQLAQKHRPNPNIFVNCLKAFLVGGLVCIIGEALNMLYGKGFGYPKEISSSMTVATLVIITCLLTGFGVYDNIGQWAGAGIAVPVTGFANSIASAALEHKAEGYVLGVGGNMFKLAGSVIAWGVFSAFAVSLIRTLIMMAIGG